MAYTCFVRRSDAKHRVSKDAFEGARRVVDSFNRQPYHDPKRDCLL